MFFCNDILNCGEYWSSPKHYYQDFNKYSLNSIENLDHNIEINSHAIFSGAAINNRSSLKKINLLKENSGIRLIAWGAGFNQFDLSNTGNLIHNIDEVKLVKKNTIKYFDLLGIRDFNLGFDYHWIPCASCLHPYFVKYRKTAPLKKVCVYYDHKKLFKVLDVLRYDYFSNDGVDLESKLEFLSNYEYIVTNSYHGAYWGLLLNRKVICLPVKSSLLNFHSPPFFLSNKEFKLINVNGKKEKLKFSNGTFDKCKNYPDFYDKCIEINYDFKKRVKEII